MQIKRNSRGNLAEFGPALILFCTGILLPLLALARFGLAITTMYFIVGQAVDSAAKAPTYGAALSSANAKLQQLAGSPIARISGLTNAPVTASLFVDEHATATGKTNFIGPNLPLAKSPDTSINSYEYEIRCLYSFDPILRSARLPCLRAIPLIGAPISFDVRATQAVEYPDGLRLL